MPDQRDVRPVKRRDERQLPSALHHLLREQRRDRMRNRVVDVQQIEIVSLRYLRHSRRERQAIRRVMEQRVLRDFDFVVVNAGNARIEPDGIRVRDEMDLVAAIRQLQSEFGGDNAAAAVRRITGDPDPHGVEQTASACVPDLAVEILRRFGLVAAAEPHRTCRLPPAPRIADHLRVPLSASRSRPPVP